MEEYIKKSNYQLQMPLYEIGAIEWYSSQARGFPRGYAKSTEKRLFQRRKKSTLRTIFISKIQEDKVCL